MKQVLLIFALVAVLATIALLFTNFAGQEGQPAGEADPAPLPPQAAPPPSLPETLYNLGGTVQSIQEDSFVMEAEIPEIQEDSSLQHTSEERTVQVTPETTITRISLAVDPATGQKRVQETVISLSSMQVGDSVEVVSRREVRGTSQIQASQIRVLPSG